MMTGKHSLEENLSKTIEKDEKELMDEMSRYPNLEKRVNRESMKTADFDIPVQQQMGG